MEVRVCSTLWGNEEKPFERFCEKVKLAGFAGLEIPFQYMSEHQRLPVKEAIKILESFELQWVAQHWGTDAMNFEQHKKEFRWSMEFLADTNPLFINSQTGKDFFTQEQSLALTYLASEVQEQTGISVLHETHRGTFTFASHITYQMLQLNPTIRLAADFSHWCVVSESYLENHSKFLNLAIAHSDYLHARIGFPQSAQVNDHRAPEWEDVAELYMGWWDKIVARNQAEGKRVFYITPEFGPVPYMSTLPFTQQPVANQWDVNMAMKDLIGKRYNNPA